MNDKPSIIMKKLNDLHPYEKNPRKNDGAVEYVANSIKEFGFKVPIVIRADGEIIAGHTRYKAAKKLGLKEIPAVIADDLTEEQVRAFRLADNKTSEMAVWDFPMLSEALQEIENSANIDFEMTDFGFTDFEIDGLFVPEEDPEEDNKAPEDELFEEEVSGRVIITYKNEEERAWIAEKLHVSLTKAVYSAEELIESDATNS